MQRQCWQTFYPSSSSEQSHDRHFKHHLCRLWPTNGRRRRSHQQKGCCAIDVLYILRKCALLMLYAAIRLTTSMLHQIEWCLANFIHSIWFQSLQHHLHPTYTTSIAANLQTTLLAVFFPCRIFARIIFVVVDDDAAQWCKSHNSMNEI